MSEKYRLQEWVSYEETYSRLDQIKNEDIMEISLNRMTNNNFIKYDGKNT